MAGDIQVREQLIVLPTGSDPAQARAAVSEGQGQALHNYGSRVMVAALPPGSDGSVRSALGGSAVIADGAGVSRQTRADLEPVEQMGLDAFTLRQSPEYLEAKAARPHDGEDWDAGMADTPGCLDHGGEGARSLEALAPAATSARLTGRVAVGIVIVEGPTKALKFSQADRVKVVAEVQNGLGWLASQSPAGVSWHYDVRVVTLSVKPDGSLSDGELEAHWRDPALDAMGYGPGFDGVRDYIEDLRDDLNTHWSYCAFSTKYPVRHFAYASIGGPRQVMHFDNDGWGPDNIDRVFAHETGHIFGAPDEYASSGCNCGGSWGYYGKPNGNCANCAPGGGVPCIMKSNSWAMCEYTPYHLGFPLVEQRYSGVWREGSDSYYLWVNASWQSFVDKWKDLADKNLRLHDLEITNTGGKRRYNGVWRHGTGGHYLWVNATWQSFVDKWKELAKKNLRLVDLEITNFGGKRRYSGVWLPGNDGYYLWVNATWQSFVDKWKSLGKKGLRLIDLEITNFGGKRRYSGVWRQGSGGYYLWVNATWQSFVDKWKDLAKKNLRLVDLEITDFGGKRRYSGVWLPGKDAYYLWVNASWQSFRQKWEDLGKEDLRLIDLEITAPSGGGASPVFDSGSIGLPELGSRIDNGGLASEPDAGGVFETPSEEEDGLGGGVLSGGIPGTLEEGGDGFGGGEVGEDSDDDSEASGDGFGGGSLDAAGDHFDEDFLGVEGDGEGLGGGLLEGSHEPGSADEEEADGYGGGSLD